MAQLPDDFMVLDTETDSVNPYTAKLDRVGTWDNDIPEYREFSYRTLTANYEQLLRDYLGTKIPKIFHNAKFDLRVLRSHNFIINGPFHDTYLLAKTWRNDLPSYNLEYLCYILFGDPCLDSGVVDVWFRKHGYTENERPMTEAPDKMVARYCKGDVLRTLKLFKFLYPKVGDSILYKLEMETMLATLEVEENGIHIDRRSYEKHLAKSQREIGQLSETLGFNVRSSHQLGAYLQECIGGLPKTESGLVRTDEKSIQSYIKQRPKDPVLKARLRIQDFTNQAAKIKGLLAATSDERPIFHPSFIQSQAITRRFSSASYYGVDGQSIRGNTQNIPPKLRKGFIAPDGFKFAVLDLSQIESRLWAHLVRVKLKDSTWEDKYNNDPTFNMYLEVAKLCKGKPITKKSKDYDTYKAVVLARYYGSGIETFAEQQNIDVAGAYKLFKATDIYLPQIRRLQQVMINEVERKGYILDDFGTRYYVPQNAAYKAVDYYCQGVAGFIFKWWLIDTSGCIKKNKWKDRIINIVHDEMDFYVNDNRFIDFRCNFYCSLLDPLQEVLGVKITADYSIGDNWATCK